MPNAVLPKNLGHYSWSSFICIAGVKQQSNWTVAASAAVHISFIVRVFFSRCFIVRKSILYYKSTLWVWSVISYKQIQSYHIFVSFSTCGDFDWADVQQWLLSAVIGFYNPNGMSGLKQTSEEWLWIMAEKPNVKCFTSPEIQRSLFNTIEESRGILWIAVKWLIGQGQINHHKPILHCSLAWKVFSRIWKPVKMTAIPAADIINQPFISGWLDRSHFD